jgi:kynurenine formamidase
MAKARATAKTRKVAKSGMKPKAKAAPKPKATVKPKFRAKPARVTAKRPTPRPSAAPKRTAPSASPAVKPRALPANVPNYDQLPIREGAPAGSAWGVFGDHDQVGTINLLTPERVKQAAGFVRSGRVFALNMSIDIPNPPIFGRGKHSHTIKKLAPYILDDYLDNFYPQASSQWDALCHVKHPTLGGYNGFPEHEITGYGGTKLGIDNLARRGIAGRGILADIGRYYDRSGRKLNYLSNDLIPLEDLIATLEAQKTTVWPGDVLLIRVGWTQAYLGLTQAEKEELARDTKCPGIEGSARTAQWLWDQHFAAVASDAPGLEVIPPIDVTQFTDAKDLLHYHMLAFFGMPIGEMWELEGLAQDCANDGHYEFFFTSAPLNVPGGVGSPPNALAIK